MRAGSVALVPTCAECDARWLPADKDRWSAYLTDDEPPEVVFYCPTARRASSATTESVVMFDPRHPGDAKNLPAFISHAPTESPVVAIRDVVVVPTTIVEGDYPGEHEQPAGDPPVELAEGIMLEDLPPEVSGLVMNACTQRGHYFLGVRQFGARYTFVREVDPAVYDAARFGWDDGNRLYFAMVLSRLIRDNGHSLEFAARLIDHERRDAASDPDPRARARRDVSASPRSRLAHTERGR